MRIIWVTGVIVGKTGLSSTGFVGGALGVSITGGLGVGGA